MTNIPKTNSILSVRINRYERALLDAAAEQSRTSLGDFVRRKALDAAETDVLNRTAVIIAAKDWEKFESWINRPAKNIQALKKLKRITLPGSLAFVAIKYRHVRSPKAEREGLFRVWPRFAQCLSFAGTPG